MAVYSGKQAAWDNIEQLYTKLNTERARLNIQPVSVVIPEEEGTPALAQDLNDLRELIVALRTNAYVNNSLGAAPFNNLSTAVRGELLKINIFNEKEDLLNQVAGVCPHDGTFSSNRANFTTNYSYRNSQTDFSYNDSCVSYLASYDASYNDSDNSYNVHNYSFGRSDCDGDKSYRGRGGG